MHPHPAKIITKARLHEGARCRVERLAGRTQNVMDNGRGFRGRLAWGRSVAAFALQRRPGLALFLALLALARRAGGFATGTLALQQTTLPGRRRHTRNSHHARMLHAHELDPLISKFALSTQPPCTSRLLEFLCCAARLNTFANGRSHHRKILAALSDAAADELDDNVLRSAIAERDARGTKQADKRFFAGNFFDDCGLAKPDFPQALAELGLAGEFADASSGTNREVGQAHALRAGRFGGAIHGREKSEV